MGEYWEIDRLNRTEPVLRYRKLNTNFDNISWNTKAQQRLDMPEFLFGSVTGHPNGLVLIRNFFRVCTIPESERDPCNYKSKKNNL